MCEQVEKRLWDQGLPQEIRNHPEPKFYGQVVAYDLWRLVNQKDYDDTVMCNINTSIFWDWNKVKD